MSGPSRNSPRPPVQSAVRREGGSADGSAILIEDIAGMRRRNGIDDDDLRDDIRRLGLRVNQQVTVRSATGEMAGVVVRAYDIRGGNALMYFPEANVLVPSATDPHSKTPAFKSVVVSVEPFAPASADAATNEPGRVALELVRG